MKTTSCKSFIALVVTMSILGGTHAQNYPTRPVRFVTGAAGANLDFSARLVGQAISPALAQPVIVENRSSGIVPMMTVAKSPADGHTLLLYGTTFWVGPLLKSLPYDPIKDFSAITIITRQPNVMIVHPSLQVSSVKELVVRAKERPGEINYASGATGSVTHLAGELFNRMAGVQITRVSYTSASVQIVDVMSGRVQLMLGNGSQVVQAIKSGKVRALAVTSREPTPLYPGLPTISASGVPGYESTGQTGVYAPAKTPAAVVKRLNHEIRLALAQPDVKQQFFHHGADTVGTSPEEALNIVKAEMVRMGKLIKEAGIREE